MKIGNFENVQPCTECGNLNAFIVEGGKCIPCYAKEIKNETSISLTPNLKDSLSRKTVDNAIIHAMINGGTRYYLDQSIEHMSRCVDDVEDTDAIAKELEDKGFKVSRCYEILDDGSKKQMGYYIKW